MSRAIATYPRFRRQRGRAFSHRHPEMKAWNRATLALYIVVMLALPFVLAIDIFPARWYAYAASYVLLYSWVIALLIYFFYRGRIEWREDQNPLTLFMGIGFIGLGISGVVSILCVSDLTHGIVHSTSCGYAFDALYLGMVWIFAWLFCALALDFRNFLRRGYRRMAVG